MILRVDRILAIPVWCVVAKALILTCWLRGSCWAVQCWWLTTRMVIMLGSSLAAIMVQYMAWRVMVWAVGCAKLTPVYYKVLGL